MAINKRFTQLNNSGSNHDLLDAYTGKITGSFEVTGAAYFPGGLSGSLQMLTDGTTMFLTGAGGITITNLANGQIEVSGAAPSAAATSYWTSPVLGVIKAEATSSMVEVPYLSASNGAEVTGSLYINSGNILETLQIDWNKIESVAGANSALTIRNTNAKIILDADANGLEVTASNTTFVGAGGVTVGSDAIFFVSGSTGTNSGNKAVFGGTTFTSGNMQLPFDAKLQSRNSASNDFADLIQLGDGSGLGLQNNTVIFGDTDQTTGFAFLQLGGPAPVGLIALITGSNEGFFSGSYKFHDGLSGSLQMLPDGVTTFLTGAGGITITNLANGQIEISGSAGATSPQYWFSTGSNETYTTGSVLLRPGLAASPTPDLIEFDVSGSALQIYDGYGGFTALNGAYIQVKDVPVADAAWDPFSGSLNIYAANVYASGAGSSVVMAAGAGGWDDVTARGGGFASLYGGTGGSTVGLPTAGTGGSVFIGGGMPGWSGGAYGVGEEGKAGNVYINGGFITNVSRSLSGSDLFIGDGNITGFRYIGFDDTSNYHLTFEQDTYFFVSGAIGAKGTTNRGVAVFGGDLHVSGGLTVDNPAIFATGLTGSLTEVSVGVPYLLAGDYITIATNSLGQIAISASVGPQWYYTTNTDEIATSGSVAITGSLSVNPAGTGRGLLKFGGLDIGPITGSMAVYGAEQSGAILSGSLLSASNGVAIESVLRHEFHVLGSGFDGSSNPNIFAATYLVMSYVNSTGNQTAIAVTELSRETSGSYATSWDVNISSNCDIEVTGSVGGSVVRWYGQRIKEMSLNSAGGVS